MCAELAGGWPWIPVCPWLFRTALPSYVRCFHALFVLFITAPYLNLLCNCTKKKKYTLGGFGRNRASYWAGIGDKTFPDDFTDELKETHRLDSLLLQSAVPCSNPSFAEISTEDEKRNKL